MIVFEWIVVVLVGAVILAGLARRIGVPYPSLLALGGVALAFLPGGPTWTLEPDLALALFIAPVLLDAAYDTSPRDLKDNWAPVTGLVLMAVGLTTVAVAVVAHAMLPGMPWAAAVALGAAVAPPDAAAATAVLRQVRLPQRLLTILEGESLLNDASSLLIYRVAVGAVAAGSFSIGNVAPTFIFAVIGSLVAGPVIAWLYLRLTPTIRDAPSAIVMQFAVTFGVWILAERLGLSGILTIVSYAITVARTAPRRTPARIRVPAYAVWDTAVFILNVLAFVMIGLQVRPIWERLDPSARMEYGLVAGAVLTTVIVVRFAWAMSYNAVARGQVARHGFHPPRPMLAPSVQSGLVISWCGMRGIVTLAAAFGLPEEFPYRDFILLTAFCVVVGTLVIQGLTLRPLLKHARFDDGDPVRHEVGHARVAAYHAAFESLADETSPEAEVLRREYEDMRDRAKAGHDGHTSVERPTDPLRRRAIAAARRVANNLRDQGVIGDTAFHRLEEEFDWAEMSASSLSAE
jgi:CPA1 family monovalent cation:H+ antiporter